MDTKETLEKLFDGGEVEENVDWRQRRELIKQLALAKNEEKEIISPLRKTFEELQGKYSRLCEELPKAEKKLKAEERSFIVKIERLEGLLRVNCPREQIEDLIHGLTVFTSSFNCIPGPLKAEEEFDRFRGERIVKSNREALKEAKEIIRVGIRDLEALMVSPISDKQEFLASFEEIKKGIQSDLETLLNKPIEAEKPFLYPPSRTKNFVQP